jgi:hypothetical protein
MTKRTNRKFLFVVTGILFAAITAISSVLFYYASEQTYGVIFFSTVAAVLILAFVISSHYSLLNRNNTDGSKKLGDYYKKILLIVGLMFFLGYGLSFGGGLIFNAILGWLRIRLVDAGSLFLSGAIVKLPIFIIFNIAVYRGLVKLGYMDAQRKSFNLRFIILTLLLALMLIMPGALRDSMYETTNPDMMGLNLHTVLSPSVDLLRGDAYNPDFSMILVILTVIASLAIEMAVGIFAYRRGKSIFLKNRIRMTDDYETDEIC